MLINRCYSSATSYYDIIIVGGGMVGSVLAKVLASAPSLSDQSILLLEGGKEKRFKSDNNYSNRVSAVNLNGKRLLKSAGLWGAISSGRCKPVLSMKVWGNSSNRLMTEFDNTEHEEHGEPLTYIIENDEIINVAFESLKQYGDRVNILYESSVKDIVLSDDNKVDPYIKLKNEAAFSCKLLLGADGYNSLVRKTMDVQYLTWNYGQQAIVATLELMEDTGNSTAWQRFISTGPIALLPLTDKLSSLVWTTTPAHCKHLLSLSDEGFVDELNSALWKPPVINTVTKGILDIVDAGLKTVLPSTDDGEVMPPTVTSIRAGSRASFPLGFGHAVKYVKPRVAVLGDAAHRVHPLAGQGVNIGFNDIKILTDLLAENLFAGGSLDDYNVLKTFETASQRYNIPRMLGIDFIQKVGGHTWMPAFVFNHMAFRMTNSLSPIKKLLIKQAME